MSARFLCIGTHHKTGTIWMRKVFRAIANDQDIPFMQCNRAKRLADLAPTGPHILVNWSSGFPTELFDMPQARFLHIIRDPRDVLLSGMRYHRIAPLGNEKFLRVKRKKWGDKNYQDYLNALPDDHARLLFEMENKHDETLTEMLGWPYGHPQAADLRYEDLIEDTDCALFRRTLENFAIEGLDIDRAVKTFWDHSLFGGLAKPGAREERVAAHVSSGATAQWMTKMSRPIADIYATRYNAALQQLGYSEDGEWPANCAAEADAA